MKLFGFALILLLAGTEAFAGMSADALRLELKCIGGQTFLTTWTAHNGDSSATTIQVYQPGLTELAPPQPATCNEDDFKPDWMKKK